MSNIGGRGTQSVSVRQTGAASVARANSAAHGASANPAGIRTGFGGAHRIVRPMGEQVRRAQLRDERAENLRRAAEAHPDPAQRFLLAYQAARAKAGVLLGPRPRRGKTAVWDRLAGEFPQLAEWAELLDAYAQRARRIELGLPEQVSAQMAADFLWAIGEFFHRIESELNSAPLVA